MKYLILILTLYIYHSSYSQLNVGSAGGCVNMYGDCGISDDGCWYYAYIQNECEYPVLIESSYYKARFRYYRTSSDKDYGTTKKIKFPDVFLAPGTSIVKDKDRDDSNTKIYYEATRHWGEMGQAYKGSSGKPEEDVIKLEENTKTFIGSKAGVNFYFELRTGADSWAGFTKYKVSLIAENQTGNKVNVDASVSYTVYFHGQPYAGYLSIKKIKGYDTKRHSEKENCLFNFTPEVYVKIKSTNIDQNGGGSSESVDGGSYADESSTSGTVSNRSGTQKTVLSTYQFETGSQLIGISNNDDYGMICFINTVGDTIFKSPAIICGDEFYTATGISISQEIKKLPKNANFQVPESAFLSGNNSDQIAVYRPSKDNFDYYYSYDQNVVGGEVYELYQPSASAPSVLRLLESQKEINSFDYKSMYMVVPKSASTINDVCLYGINSSKKMGVVNVFGHKMADFKYSYISSYAGSKEMYEYFVPSGSSWKVNKNQGYMDLNYKVVLPAKYNYVRKVYSDYYLVINKISVGNKTDVDYADQYEIESMEIGVLDKDGEVLIDFGKIKYVILTSEFDPESTLTVNKKKINDHGGKLLAEITEGRVNSIIFPECSEIKFEGDFPCKEFVTIEDLRFFVE